MATHSSIPAWRIPWTEEPGGLQSMGSQRVGPDWVTHTHTHTISFAANSKRHQSVFITQDFLSKYSFLGFSETTLVLFPFFLSCLPFFIFSEGPFSSWPFKSFPQGSVLGSLIFSTLFLGVIICNHDFTWATYMQMTHFYSQPRLLFEFQTCIFNCLLSPFSLTPPHTTPKLYHTLKHLSLSF